jgi:GNAT superfamily N-acetyltransferase
MAEWQNLVIVPVTPEHWDDLETLFGLRGAYGGCWCMFWRLPSAQFTRQSGEGNRQALQQIVNSGEVPGLLAYVDETPVGWVSVAPRTTFTRLERSRVLKAVDDLPVWSVVCFFVEKKYRRLGLTVELLKAAAAFAAEHGASILEGYPIDVGDGKYPDAYAYTGLVAAYEKAGFTEVARRSERRPIMRIHL